MSARQNETTPRISNHGCCVLILLGGAVAVIVLAILAYFALQYYTQMKIASSLTPTEFREFRHWLQTPLPHSGPPPLTKVPLEVMEEKERVKKAALATTHQVPQINTNSLTKKLAEKRKLSATDQEALTTFTEVFASIVEDARNLVHRPDYAFEHPVYPGPNSQFGGWTMLSSLFRAYIRGCVLQEKWNEAIGAIDVGLEMIRIDTGVTFIGKSMSQLMQSRFVQAATELSMSTSDTAVLQQLLKVLNDHAPSAAPGILEVTPLEYRQAQADGYLPAGQPTGMQTMRFTEDNKDYLRWLIKTLPPESSRHTWAQDALNRATDNYGYGYPAKVLEKLDNKLLRPLLKPYIRLNTMPIMAGSWKYTKYNDKRSASFLREYHLARLDIARRIAALNGDPIPKTRADLVPRYMPDYPEDVLTTELLSLHTAAYRDTATTAGRTTSNTLQTAAQRQP